MRRISIILAKSNMKRFSVGMNNYILRLRCPGRTLRRSGSRYVLTKLHPNNIYLWPFLHCRDVTAVRPLSVRYHSTKELFTDVGGGSVKNSERNSLARIPLRWMIRECFKAKSGIIFDKQGLRELGLDPSRLSPVVLQRRDPIAVRDAAIQTFPARVYKDTPKPPSLIHRWFSRLKNQPHSFPHIGSAPVDHTKVEETEVEEPKVEEIPIGSEEEEDLKDALSPIFSTLKLQPGWWFLEFLPLKVRYQQGDTHWVETVM
jgi:hypothetical protein